MHQVRFLFRQLSSFCAICLLLFSVSGISMLFSGCGTPPKPAEEDPETEEAPPKPADEEPPPKKLKPLPTFERITELPSTTLTWELRDGLLLTGQLYDPHQNQQRLEAVKAENNPEDQEEPETPEPELDENGEPLPPKPPAPPVPKHRYPLLILLHGLGDSYKDWAYAIPPLVKAGYAVLAVDLRGHGGSTQFARSSADPSQPNTAVWRYLPSTQWVLLPNDINTVLTAFGKPKLHPKETAPQVQETPVVLMGAGLGANVALLLGSQAPKRIKAIVALSPQLSIKGLQPALSVLELQAPVFYAVSTSTPDSMEATKKLYKLTQSHPKVLHLYKPIGTGSEMLRNNPVLLPTILQWLQTDASANNVAE